MNTFFVLFRYVWKFSIFLVLLLIASPLYADTDALLNAKLEEAAIKVRKASSTKDRLEAAEQLAVLIRGADSDLVDDKTIADIISLVQFWETEKILTSDILGCLGYRVNIQLNMKIEETVSRIRETRPTYTTNNGNNAGSQLLSLIRPVNSIFVDDKTVADIISLLDIPDRSVQFWATLALVPFGARAKAAAPRLLVLLQEEDCEIILKGGCYCYNGMVLGTAIRPMLERMGIKAPPIPSLEDCQGPHQKPQWRQPRVDPKKADRTG